MGPCHAGIRQQLHIDPHPPQRLGRLFRHPLVAGPGADHLHAAGFVFARFGILGLRRHADGASHLVVLARGKGGSQGGGLVGGDAGRHYGLPGGGELPRDLANFCGRFALGENDFGKAASALAIQVNVGACQSIHRQRLVALSKLGGVNVSGKQVACDLFERVVVHVPVYQLSHPLRQSFMMSAWSVRRLGSRRENLAIRPDYEGYIRMPSCVLAYSGGLDTSVILGWLNEQGFDVHAVYVDLGQPCEDREAILEKARKIGAASAQVIDVQEELCRDFAFPVLAWQARYEQRYLLGTSIARPLISKVCLQVARNVGAETYAHGATGKGNDQCRFELAANALNPDVTVLAPWRMAEFRELFPGRSEMIAYCNERDIPIKASADKPYSSDENCLHISYEAGKLEELDVNGVELVEFGMSVSPEEAPDQAEEVKLEYEAGVPVAVNGERLSAIDMVTRLNEIGGRHGVGRIDIVEGRFVGMKSRGVYEAPGMSILYDGLMYLEQLCMDRDLMHLRDRLAPEVAEMVYYGFWYTPKLDALMSFIKTAQHPVNGSVTLKLYKGNIGIVSRTQPRQPLR